VLTQTWGEAGAGAGSDYNYGGVGTEGVGGEREGELITCDARLSTRLNQR
jgi:hypothetical protein